MRRLIPLAVLAACTSSDPASPDPHASARSSAAPSGSGPQASASAVKPKPRAPFSSLDRATFNRMAMRLDLPLLWKSDDDKNGLLAPKELAVLLFYPDSDKRWLDGGTFGPDFAKAYARMEAEAAIDPAGKADRAMLLRAELDEAASVVVATAPRPDAAEATEEKALLRHVLAAAKLVDALYAKQTGAAALAAKVPDEPFAKSVFRRSWGPGCVTPKLQANKDCAAVPGVSKALVDVYPASLQAEAGFCKKLEAHPDSKKLLDPFVVVREKDGKLVPVSYAKAYEADMKAIAAELLAARKVLGKDEKAMDAYLEAAAKAFETNDWVPADEAWSKMNARNSKYYLRIAPDEVYWDPCRQKAGFHVSFARINRASLALQDKLTPHRQAMEDDLAARAGAPYAARKVKFALPDFIDVVFNAGDSRPPVGITIGQSLPNWGPVQKEGRGRTVAMVNLYGDPDSMHARTEKARSLLGPATMKRYPTTGWPGQLSTVLHEATHNLGPTHEWKTGGKKDTEAFGGDLASVLEELKAQTGALYFLGFLKKRGVLEEKEVEEAYVDSIVWALNHVSRGMKEGDGGRKPYSELAAIQIGFLIDKGALSWDPARMAANGKDEGSFELDLAKLGPAIDEMMAVVGAIKAKNDKEGALKLEAAYADTSKVVPHEIIKERCGRFPQPTFVFSITP